MRLLDTHSEAVVQADEQIWSVAGEEECLGPLRAKLAFAVDSIVS